ncbi:hypothetical protein Pmani_021153 [Petrolisthes manimaculis]|uniref:Growth and transformation-dependent protein n=1 Tax=Petrolisthes manimaculis TaxID=1843537 RepID=A0AAE1PG75_9EUCA|nr:hypothetical protein Pmani_021153 [Petrolisthes manimaculis]
MSLALKLRVMGVAAVQRRAHNGFLPLASRVLYSQEARSGTTELTADIKKEIPDTPMPPKGRIRLTDHRASYLEKRILVWGGKYKSVDEVPDFVSQDSLDRAQNKARIKINLMMVAATLLACLTMVYSGKRAQEAGESVVKMNEDWHKAINKEAEEAKKK